jgi:hypothetical protein
MKSRNWLASHRRMFAYYGGVPHVTVPDCLKQGVLKCHLYDPDLNPGMRSWPRITPPRWCRRVPIIPRTKRSSKGWSKS